MEYHSGRRTGGYARGRAVGAALCGDRCSHAMPMSSRRARMVARRLDWSGIRRRRCVQSHLLGVEVSRTAPPGRRRPTTSAASSAATYSRSSAERALPRIGPSAGSDDAGSRIRKQRSSNRVRSGRARGDARANDEMMSSTPRAARRDLRTERRLARGRATLRRQGARPRHERRRTTDDRGSAALGPRVGAARALSPLLGMCAMHTRACASDAARMLLETRSTVAASALDGATRGGGVARAFKRVVGSARALRRERGDGD